MTTRRNAAPTGLRFATWRGFSPTGRQNLDGHFSTESRYAITISFPAFQYLFTGAVFYYTYSTESSDVSTPVIQLYGAKTSSLKVGGFLVYASLVPFPCFRRNLVTCPAVSTPCQLSPSSVSSHIRVFCQHPSPANKTFYPRPADSIGHSVRPSLRPSVRPSVPPSVHPSKFTFFTFLAFTGVFCITAPAHQHATWVAAYPALFPFLVADTQLLKRLCPSVRPLVRRSVRRSVTLSSK